VLDYARLHLLKTLRASRVDGNPDKEACWEAVG
jgi:hypothetical protein